MSDPNQNPGPDDTSAYPPPSGSYHPAGGPPGAGRPADLTNRFLARLIDFILLAVVNAFLVSFIVIGMVMGQSGGFYGMGNGAGYAASAVSAIVTAAIYLGYFAVMESRTGQTVGKMVLKLETRGPDGGHPTMEQAVKRNAFTALGVLGVIPVIGGFIGALASLAAIIAIAVTINNNTATRQGWHDEFAGGTTVVKLG